jgi:hypothetical protein
MTVTAHHPRTAEVLTALADAQHEMDTLVAELRVSVPAESLAEPPLDGTWSLAQVVEHLAIVEDGVGRLVSTMIRDVGEAMESEDTLVAPGMERLRIWDPVARRIVAPDMVAPSGQLTFDDAVERQRTARQRLMAAYAAASGRALATVQRPHPVLGPLNGYQWGHMAAQHQQRHLTQIRSILSSRA